MPRAPGSILDSDDRLSIGAMNHINGVTSPIMSSLTASGEGPSLPVFPMPRADLMRKMSSTSSSDSPQKSPWRQRYKTLRRMEHPQFIETVNLYFG